MCVYFYCNCNYCNFSHFAMSRLYLEKNWKNLNRGVHFCLFSPFFLLITSNLRSVYPPPRNLSFHRCTLGEGCTLCYLLTVRALYLKMGKSAPPYLKTLAKKYSERGNNERRLKIFTSLSGPL